MGLEVVFLLKGPYLAFKINKMSIKMWHKINKVLSYWISIFFIALK